MQVGRSKHCGLESFHTMMAGNARIRCFANVKSCLSLTNMTKEHSAPRSRLHNFVFLALESPFQIFMVLKWTNIVKSFPDENRNFLLWLPRGLWRIIFPLCRIFPKSCLLTLALKSRKKGRNSWDFSPASIRVVYWLKGPGWSNFRKRQFWVDNEVICLHLLLDLNIFWTEETREVPFFLLTVFFSPWGEI